MSLININKELARELKEQAARLSVLESKKITQEELVERYIIKGLKAEKKRRFIKSDK